jgi:hypothetical protein
MLAAAHIWPRRGSERWALNQGINDTYLEPPPSAATAGGRRNPAGAQKASDDF